MKKNITLLRDFKEDNRISMDLYADFLSAGISKHYPDEYLLSEYFPKVPRYLSPFPDGLNTKMRILRYLSYPQQMKQLGKGVFHVIEHGYAHLLKESNLKDKGIVTVHDLIPMLKWKGMISGMKSGGKPRFSMYSLSFLENARKIIAISENTKKDLVHLLGLNPNKIDVIYYGVGSEFKPNTETSKKELRQCLGLPHHTKLILITGQEQYKNHQACLQAMQIIEKKYDRPVQIVRLGKNNNHWQEIKECHNLENEIINIETLALSKVAELYNSVDMLLFPSHYEGFGRPPIEAMACGLPVVCSNAASLPEVIGDAALVSQPDDYKQISENVLSILNNNDLEKDLIERGFKNALRFSWTKNIEKTINIYNKVLSDNQKKTKKIVFFQRKMDFYGSIELYFSGVRKYLPDNYNLKVFKSSFISKGFFKRIFNILEVYSQQSDINHITGDVHFLAYLLNKKKTILSVMDCGSVSHSKGLRRMLFKLLWFTIPSKKVSAITVISEKTKNELISIINYPPENIHVIPVCLNTQFTYERKILFNKELPHIMHIGTTRNKNLSRVCQAIKGMNCHLEIIGDLNGTSELKQLKEYDISFSNSFALKQEELIEKYLQTDILIFVSTYEGFGVPIVEAQSMGIPVITSNLSPMIEVSGGSAALVNPYDIDEIRAAINKINTDDDYRNTLIKDGLINARKYHPEKVTSMFEELYDRI